MWPSTVQVPAVGQLADLEAARLDAVASGLRGPGVEDFAEDDLGPLTEPRRHQGPDTLLLVQVHQPDVDLAPGHLHAVRVGLLDTQAVLPPEVAVRVAADVPAWRYLRQVVLEEPLWVDDPHRVFLDLLQDGVVPAVGSLPRTSSLLPSIQL